MNSHAQTHTSAYGPTSIQEIDLTLTTSIQVIDLTLTDFRPGDGPDPFRNGRVNQEISSKDSVLLLCFRDPNSHPNGFKFPWPNPRTRGRRPEGPQIAHPRSSVETKQFSPTSLEKCEGSVRDWTASPLLYVNYSLPSPLPHFALHFLCSLHQLSQLTCALLS